MRKSSPDINTIFCLCSSFCVGSFLIRKKLSDELFFQDSFTVFSIALKVVQPFPFIKGVRGLGIFFFRYIVLPFFLCVKIKTFSMIVLQ